MPYRMAVSCLVAMMFSTSALAGDLNPPVGPVAETGRFGPRTEISAANTPGDGNSLFKITRPGSYYLAGDVTGIVAKGGIEVASSGVAIDLNGFEVRGVAGSLSGIFLEAGFTNLQISNGSVREWGSNGVNAAPATSSVLRNLHADGNLEHGMLLGTGGLIESCTASFNGYKGFDAGLGSTVSGSTAVSNGREGISADENSVVRACVARLNGFDGILVGAGGVISGCSASGNMEGGLFAGVGSTIIGCAAWENSFDGIRSNGATTIAHCTSNFNTGDGIQVHRDALVLNCVCNGNGLNANDGAGIHATGNGNRFEGNSVTSADRGIDVDGTLNQLIGNSAIGNTVNFDIDGTDNFIARNIASGGAPNYSIVVGNSVAPRVGVVASDGWGGIIDADHPWANFGF